MLRLNVSRALALSAAVVLPLVLVTPVAHAAARLTATLTAANFGSYNTKYVINNGGDATSDNWRVEFDLPSGTTVGGVLYGVKSGTASHVVIDAEYYNKAVPAGRNTEPYSPLFELIGSGQPANCRINGNKCDGSADRPPGAPGNVTSTGKTTRTVSTDASAYFRMYSPLQGHGLRSFDPAPAGTGA